MRKARVGSIAVRAAAAALLASTAACSSVPDAVNPAEWYRSASGWFAGDGTADARVRTSGVEREVPAPRPAETADTFPNLASVPDRPRPTTDPLARREITTTLRREGTAAQAAADALSARAADEVARRELPPTVAAPAAIPAPAPAATTAASLLSAPPLSPPPAARPAAPPEPAAPAPAEAVPAAAASVPPAAPEAAMPEQAPVARAAAGFTPGARLSPRPPVLPPNPLSVQAAG
ncbi:MAG: hypothetical protein ACK4QW_06315 [Alphaproteobacteria bacterium]